jgi:hypothetical protein
MTKGGDNTLRRKKRNEKLISTSYEEANLAAIPEGRDLTSW